MPRLLGTLAAAALVWPAGAEAAGLSAGVGRADLTPPTGYAFGGWSRADREGEGVHTRLQASALVLRRGGRKIALVSAALRLTSGGTLAEVAARVADLGLDERTIFLSATHTHAGPAPIAAFPSFNGVAPSIETVDRPQTATDFFVGETPADPALYRFVAERIAVAIRRADARLGPAEAGWGEAELIGVTRNRSLEAHLADHGILAEPRQGKPHQDPEGAAHTIDPIVRVLRVDRLGRGRDGRRRPRTPLGAWASFANHGTVNPSEFEVYNADHHATATAELETGIRRAGRVPEGRPVIAVYGNGNEGDLSAGLDGQGPLVAERVGRAEGAAMLTAWRRAGRRLRRSPALDSRWTRVCFCGQPTAAGPVATSPAFGVPFLTGSEEGRGPLYDLTGVPFEGLRSPGSDPEQGRKIVFERGDETTYPKAVPLAVVRIGDHVVITAPGEATVETGRRARAAVMAALGPRSGVRAAVVSGLTNEHVQYLTTPEEYDRQHYEGGSTPYGPAAGTFVAEQLGALARALAQRVPAPEPFPFDPRNGLVAAEGPAYPAGASRGQVTAQPADAVRPGSQLLLAWSGGPGGHDRPLDEPFVAVERRTGRRWAPVATDLGRQILWTVDGEGLHRAVWQVPRDARTGRHRMVVTARNYRIASRDFTVDPAAAETRIAPGLPADHPAARFAPFSAR